MGFENGRLVRVTLEAVHSSGPIQVNTLHYDLQDSPIPGNSPNDPQSLADRLRDDLLPVYRGIFDSGWTIQPVIVQEEKDPLHPTAARSEWLSGSAATGTYTVSGDVMPPACTSVAKLVTDHIGRRNTGRIFLGGTMRESDQNGGILNSTALARYQAVLDAIPHQPDVSEGVSPSTANWCVYSRTSRSQNVDPYASHITNAILRANVHWLRSRER